MSAHQVFLLLLFYFEGGRVEHKSDFFLIYRSKKKQFKKFTGHPKEFCYQNYLSSSRMEFKYSEHTCDFISIHLKKEGKQNEGVCIYIDSLLIIAYLFEYKIYQTITITLYLSPMNQSKIKACRSMIKCIVIVVL